METINLENDIKVYCITAESFPDGVLQAHQALHAKIPFSTDRRYFGLSRMENGKIIYRAGAERTAADPFDKNVQEELTIPAGIYQSLIVKDFMNDVPAIGTAFDQLIHLPGIDPDGYCIEWYTSDKDVRCMVKLK